MILTKKTIPRRTILRGLGAAVALPLLDSMIPAAVAQRHTAAAPKARLAVVYVPNGMEMSRWTPNAPGSLFELPVIMRPLTDYRDQMLVVSGLALAAGNALPGEGTGDHARAGATFLTATHPKKTEGSDVRAGVSMDQIAAVKFGEQTQFASLELALESTELLGACDAGYSCAYVNTIAWRTPTTPLATENNPRFVFERLFGDGDSTSASDRAARMRQEKSVLDYVNDKVAKLNRELGGRDRVKLDEYLAAVRDVERRIQRAEAQSATQVPTFIRPSGIPESYGQHAALMFDLQVLAYQADLTRVTTIMMGNEVSAHSYPEIGVADPHHPVSHHQGNPDKLDKLARINTYHVTLFRQFVEKLKQASDGDASLLDQTITLYGAGMSDSNLHIHEDIPLLVVGGSAMGLKGNRHLQYAKGTPAANLYITLLDRLGIPLETFADSTEPLQELSGV